jgi:CRP-like cAMP-binding protein
MAARPPYGDRIRGWLGRVLRPGVADEPKLPTTGTGHPSRRDRTARNIPERAPTQPAAVSFWEELNQTERAALLSVAYWVKFSIGDKLMREGEPADYVIVIIEGQTRVCVDTNGLERVLAERGPGQLVGERGGLQVGVRSASVIAVEPVWGLMVLTADFLAFVGDHPRVLDIVESQLYDRLIEDRPPRAFSMESGARRPGTVWPALTAGQLRAWPLNGHNCTILFTDVVAFGSPTRNDQDRRMIREALYGMTNMMLRGIGDARSEDRGDGLLTVVPPGVPTAEIMERLVKELPSALARHNTTFRDSARFQLRAAINVGPVTTDAMGVSGEAIIIAARLVEAPSFKEAMARTHANVGIIASRFVYDAVIKHSPNSIDAAGYSQVQVSLKGFATPAWIKLFTTSPSFSLYQSAAASNFDWRL